METNLTTFVRLKRVRSLFYISLPGIQESNKTTPVYCAKHITGYYNRYSRKSDITDAEYATPQYDKKVSNFVSLIGDVVSGKHFDIGTINAANKPELRNDTSCDNLPPVFHNMFPKWKKACRK